MTISLKWIELCLVLVGHTLGILWDLPQGKSSYYINEINVNNRILGWISYKETLESVLIGVLTGII